MRPAGYVSLVLRQSWVEIDIAGAPVDEFEKMKRWCRTYDSDGNYAFVYKHHSCPNQTAFQFEKEADAIMFRLKFTW